MIDEISKLKSVVDQFGIKIDHIFDVGLGKSDELFDFNEAFSPISITAFEANPFNNFDNKPDNAQIYKTAVGSKTGSLKFNAGKESTLLQGSIYKPLSTAMHINKGKFVTVKVPCVRLDEFINSHKNVPDLLWIDTQGSEFEVLKGLGKYLSSIKIIHLELFIHPETEYESAPSFDVVDEFLTGFGFQLVSGNPTEGIFDNFIYVKR